MRDRYLNVDEIENLFKFIDANGNKSIDKIELETALKKFGIGSSFVEGIFNNIDTDHSNSIDFEEFKKYIIEQEEKLIQLYNKFDKNKDAKFNLEDLSSALREYYPNKKFDEMNLKHLIENIDINHNGIIEFEEFRDILLFLPDKNIEYLLDWGRQTTVLMNELNDAFPIQFIADNLKQDKDQGLYFKFLINLIAGGASAAISRTFTAPLDRLKTLYQVNYSGLAKPPSQIKGLIEIYRNDGFKGFFKGNLVNVLKASPDTSIKFACFELMKQLYLKNGKTNKNKEISPWLLFIFGSISGLFSAFCIYPLHVLRIRLAAAPSGKYIGIMDAVKKIGKEEGKIKPFFAGLAASSYLIILNSGLNLMTYDMMRNFYCTISKKKEIPLSYFMFIGALSSAITNLICYPLQLVSTRMIMQGLKGENKSTLQITKDIIKFEGLLGFYKGLSPLMTKLLIGSAIAFSSYEKIKARILRWK